WLESLLSVEPEPCSNGHRLTVDSVCRLGWDAVRSRAGTDELRHQPRPERPLFHRAQLRYPTAGSLAHGSEGELFGPFRTPVAGRCGRGTGTRLPGSSIWSNDVAGVCSIGNPGSCRS